MTPPARGGDAQATDRLNFKQRKPLQVPCRQGMQQLWNLLILRLNLSFRFYKDEPLVCLHRPLPAIETVSGPKGRAPFFARPFMRNILYANLRQKSSKFLPSACARIKFARARKIFIDFCTQIL